MRVTLPAVPTEETTQGGNEDLRWVEITPDGEKFVIAVAPRGFPLYYVDTGPTNDLGADLVGFAAQGIVAFAFRNDETWKVGLFRGGAMTIRRCVWKQTGLSEADARREADRLRSCVRRGDFPG